MSEERANICTHFRPDNKNVAACGKANPTSAAYDGRDVDCEQCRKTEAWKQYTGAYWEKEAGNE